MVVVVWRWLSARGVLTAHLAPYISLHTEIDREHGESHQRNPVSEFMKSRLPDSIKRDYSNSGVLCVCSAFIFGIFVCLVLPQVCHTQF